MAEDPRAQRLPAALGAASLLLFAGFLLPASALAPAIAMLAVAFPLGLIALGARRGGRRLGPLGPLLLALLAVLEGSLLAILAVSGSGGGDAPASGDVLGLPLGAWLQLAGFFLVPLLLVTLGYAATFDRWTLGDADLERLAALRAARAPDEGATPKR